MGFDLLSLNQEQPKHLLIEKILDGIDSGSGSGIFRGSCLKNALTAPVTPSSFSMALASSIARSLTWDCIKKLNEIVIFS